MTDPDDYTGWYENDTTTEDEYIAETPIDYSQSSAEMSEDKPTPPFSVVPETGSIEIYPEDDDVNPISQSPEETTTTESGEKEDEKGIQSEPETTTVFENTTVSEGTEMILSENDSAPTEKSEQGLNLLLLAIGFCALGLMLGALIFKFVTMINKKRKVKKLEVVTLQGLGCRENQQDALMSSDPDLYQEKGVLLCVADGMGGLQNGDQISQTAVNTINNIFENTDYRDPERLVATMVQNANQAVKNVLGTNYRTGGTTLLVGYARQGRFYCASVGDSRICLCRNGNLFHLTKRHTLEDELLLEFINGGVAYDYARGYEKKDGLTSYLGMGNLKYVDFPSNHVKLCPGDRFILMSDGIFNTLSDDEIVSVLKRNPKRIPTILNKKIQKKTSKFQDNYSAAVLVVK